MTFSPEEFEALKSLIDDEEDTLVLSKLKIKARRLDLHKLRVRAIVFGEDALDDREEEALRELPSIVDELEEAHKLIEERLEKLRAYLPSGK